MKKHKFQDVYVGPYRVLNASDSYVEIMKGKKRVKIHKNLIKRANANYDKEPPVSTPIISLDDLINGITFTKNHNQLNYESG